MLEIDVTSNWILAPCPSLHCHYSLCVSFVPKLQIYPGYLSHINSIAELEDEIRETGSAYLRRRENPSSTFFSARSSSTSPLGFLFRCSNFVALASRVLQILFRTHYFNSMILFRTHYFNSMILFRTHYFNSMILFRTILCFKGAVKNFSLHMRLLF